MSFLITCPRCDVVQQSPESKRNHAESDLIESWLEWGKFIICFNCGELMETVNELHGSFQGIR